MHSKKDARNPLPILTSIACAEEGIDDSIAHAEVACLSFIGSSVMIARYERTK